MCDSADEFLKLVGCPDNKNGANSIAQAEWNLYNFIAYGEFGPPRPNHHGSATHLLTSTPTSFPLVDVQIQAPTVAVSGAHAVLAAPVMAVAAPATPAVPVKVVEAVAPVAPVAVAAPAAPAVPVAVEGAVAPVAPVAVAAAPRRPLAPPLPVDLGIAAL